MGGGSLASRGEPTSGVWTACRTPLDTSSVCAYAHTRMKEDKDKNKHQTFSSYCKSVYANVHRGLCRPPKAITCRSSKPFGPCGDTRFKNRGAAVCVWGPNHSTLNRKLRRKPFNPNPMCRSPQLPEAPNPNRYPTLEFGQGTGPRFGSLSAFS